MGLMTLGLVLAGCVAAMELYIVHCFTPEKFKPEDYPNPIMRFVWQQVYKLGPWIESKPAHGLIFSLGLSIAVGIIFPAAGVAVMLAGVASTIATQPVYAARRAWVKFKGEHPQWFKEEPKTLGAVVDLEVVRDERRAG